MAARDSTARQPRPSRRRPDAALPEVEQLAPRSRLTREQVVAHQRERILAGMAAALAYHGYEDTRVADVIELAGVSRSTFYEHFEGKEQCFAATYEDGVERLVAAVEAAAEVERGWDAQVAAGLAAGLEFLAAEPALAHLLLVEALAASRPLRLEHERNLVRLGEALRPPASDPGGRETSEETGRLLAGGLASLLSGRVLAGEVERLPESQVMLLGYLLAPSPTAAEHAADGG